MPALRSPRYLIRIPAAGLSAGETKYFDLQADATAAQQIPYNNIVIRNFSNQRLVIEYGDTTIPLGGSEIFSDDEAFGIRDIKIRNSDIVNPLSDDVFIILSRNISQTAAVLAGLTGENLTKLSNGNGEF